MRRRFEGEGVRKKRKSLKKKMGTGGTTGQSAFSKRKVSIYLRESLKSNASGVKGDQLGKN